jgi:hypothetical protein
MAELLNRIPTNLTEYPNSFKRQGAFPLEAYSVFYTMADAEAYASTNAVSYVGQTLAVVTANAEDTSVVDSVTLYIIADAAGTLQEVGRATSGDGNSIVLDENGVLSLAGFAAAASATLPQKQADGTIKWVAIDAIVKGDGNTKSVVLSDDTKVIVTPEYTKDGDTYTYKIKLDLSAYYTAEEVDDAIAEAIGTEATEDAEATGIYVAIAEAEARAKAYADANDTDTVYDDTALKARVKTIEDDYLKAADKYDDTALAGRVTTAEGKITAVETAVATEKTRAEAAEKALGERIDVIDFVDADELADAIKDFATTAYVDGEIDKIEEAIADLNHFKAEVVASIDDVKDLGVLYLIKDESVEGVDKYNEYIVVDGAPVLIGDTTTDLSNYYNKTEIDATVETINGAIADEVDAREALAEEVEALKAVDNATQEELDAYKLEVTEAIKVAKEAAISDVDGKLATKVATADFEEFKTANTSAISTAKQEAIDAAKAAEEAKGYAVANDVAETYATKEELEDAVDAIELALDDYALVDDVNEALDLKADAADVYTKTEIDSKIGTPGKPAVTDAEGNEVTAAVQGTGVFANAYSRAEIDKLLDEVQGGSSASADSVLRQLNTYKSTNDERVAAIETSLADGGDTAKAIAAAQTQADKGVEEAAKANAAITALTDGQVNTNKTDITAIKGRLDTLDTAKGDHETRLVAAEGDIKALKTTTANNSSAIGVLQGNITTLTNEDSRLAGLITALGSSKADATAVYTKAETDAAIKVVGDKVDAIDLTPFAKTADVNATIEAVNAEIAKKANADSVYTKDEADLAFMTETEVADKINALINAADPEGGKTIENIQNLVKYVDDNAGEIAGLISTVDGHTTAIQKNAEDIVAINKTIAGVKTDIAAIIQPKASTEISVGTDGTLGINEISTDKLVQGSDTLILRGGNAEVPAAE